MSVSQNHPTGNPETARFWQTIEVEWLWRQDCVDREETPAKSAIRAIRAVRAARADWFKRGYRPAVPDSPNPRESGQTFKHPNDAA